MFGELEHCYNGIVWVIAWEPNKTIDIGEWLICTCGWLMTSVYMYMYIFLRIIYLVLNGLFKEVVGLGS